MTITLVAVQSLNGKITKGCDPHQSTWTSKEDQQYFYNLIDKADAIIMGRVTYEIAKPHIKHRAGLIRVVLTKSPDKYLDHQIENRLQFTADTPEQVISRLKKMQKENILILGGEQVNGAFLDSEQVDNVLLTLEPLLFHSGKEFAIIRKNHNLVLISSKILNKKGTLLLKYRVNY